MPSDIRNIEVWVYYSNWMRSLEMLLVGRPHIESPDIYYATDITFERQSADEAGAHIEPLVHLSPHAAQKLMDDLWTCGLRPSDGTDNLGQLQATQQHLADMRRLTFSRLRIEEPVLKKRDR